MSSPPAAAGPAGPWPDSLTAWGDVGIGLLVVLLVLWLIGQGAPDRPRPTRPRRGAGARGWAAWSWTVTIGQARAGGRQLPGPAAAAGWARGRWQAGTVTTRWPGTRAGWRRARPYAEVLADVNDPPMVLDGRASARPVRGDEPMPATTRRPAGRRPVRAARARGRGRGAALSVAIDLDWREVLAGDARFAEMIEFVKDRIADFATATGMEPGESFDNAKTFYAVTLALGELGTTLADALDVVESDTYARAYSPDVVAAVAHMAEGASGIGAGAVELIEAAQREHPDDFSRGAGRGAEPIAS